MSSCVQVEAHGGGSGEVTPGLGVKSGQVAHDRGRGFSPSPSP